MRSCFTKIINFASCCALVIPVATAASTCGLKDSDIISREMRDQVLMELGRTPEIQGIAMFCDSDELFSTTSGVDIQKTAVIAAVKVEKKLGLDCSEAETKEIANEAIAFVNGVKAGIVRGISLGLPMKQGIKDEYCQAMIRATRGGM